MEFIAMVGAFPLKMRGVCAVIATARNAGGGALVSHAWHVPFVARYRFSQPSVVPLMSGVPDSM